jgi:hypothetical protein
VGPKHAEGALAGSRGGGGLAVSAQTLAAPRHDQREPPLVPEGGSVGVHGLEVGKDRPEIAERDQRESEPRADLERAARAVVVFGEMRQGDERLLAQARRFPIGPALPRPVAGLAQQARRQPPLLGPERMVRERLDLLLQPPRMYPLDGLDDPRVHRAAALQDEAGVGDLVSEGVLERVLGLGKEPRLVEKLCALEASETLLKRALLLAGDRRQQRVGNVLADGRGGLEELLSSAAR